MSGLARTIQPLKESLRRPSRSKYARLLLTQERLKAKIWWDGSSNFRVVGRKQ